MTLACDPLLQMPPGVQCFVGDEARRRRRLEERVVAVFEGWDYEEIIPPLVDYAEVFSAPGAQARAYSFVGRDGSLLALRTDFTSLLAKIGAGRLADQPAPLRLYYSGEVVRYETPHAGRQSELHQMGLERLGGDRRLANAEVLAIAAECLAAAGVENFLLSLGHVGVFAGLVAKAGLEPSTQARLRECVGHKSASDLREALDVARVAPAVGQALLRLVTLDGGREVLDEARQVCAGFPAALDALDELAELTVALEAAGLSAHVALDLAELRGFDYYTGLLFRFYAPGSGFELGGGGRYDGLLARFGRPLPAVGFMLGLDRLSALLRGTLAPGASARTTAVPAADDVATALALARAARARGERVRLGNGSAR
jgi:ATP phosphoribosyltransferase regulatory subunit